MRLRPRSRLQRRPLDTTQSCGFAYTTSERRLPCPSPTGCALRCLRRPVERMAIRYSKRAEQPQRVRRSKVSTMTDERSRRLSDGWCSGRNSQLAGYGTDANAAVSQGIFVVLRDSMRRCVRDLYTHFGQRHPPVEHIGGHLVTSRVRLRVLPYTQWMIVTVMRRYSGSHL